MVRAVVQARGRAAGELVRPRVPGREHVQALVAAEGYDSSIYDGSVTIPSANATTYWIESTVGNATWHKAGPGADIVSGGC